MKLLQHHNVHFMDFDGTITRNDSMLSFLKFAAGTFNFYFGMLWLLPQLLWWKLKGMDKRGLKERLILYFLKGKRKSELESLSALHFERFKDKLLRPGAVQYIRTLEQQQEEVCIVTASLEIWVEPFADFLKATLIATRPAYDEHSFFTGISGANCNHLEKVNRIREMYDFTSFTARKYSYGNSKGDQDLYRFADRFYHKHF